MIDRCIDCNEVKEVEVKGCPFDDEIHGKYTEIVICKDCYREREKEI